MIQDFCDTMLLWSAVAIAVDSKTDGYIVDFVRYQLLIVRIIQDIVTVIYKFDFLLIHGIRTDAEDDACKNYVIKLFPRGDIFIRTEFRDVPSRTS